MGAKIIYCLQMAIQLCFCCVLIGCAVLPENANYARVPTIKIVQDRAPVLGDIPANLFDQPDPIPIREPYERRGNLTPYAVRGKQYELLDMAEGYEQMGVASWYGQKFHGRLTSNGERYDMYALTAAHRYLPIPAYVRVTNLDNGRSVVVRVNDRGPFHDERMIDLSYAAAVKLDFVESGTARVHVVALTPWSVDSLVPSYKSNLLSVNSQDTVALRQQEYGIDRLPLYLSIVDDKSFLYVGAFQDFSLAYRFRGLVENAFGRPVELMKNEHLYSVHLGPFDVDQGLHGYRDRLWELYQIL